MEKRLLSITETANELTNDIDIAGPLGIVRLLRQSDAQILNGWRTHAALLDAEIMAKIEQAVRVAKNLLEYRGPKRIVISGAGTSGRLSMFAARTFNNMLIQKGKEPIFEYLIAGGDKALIRAQEGAEDDPRQAVVDLRKALGDAKRAIYIGVTCGLSAPYVAGQIDFLKEKRSIFSILLGFNTADRARNAKVEKWDKTFRDVVYDIVDRKNCLLLNPIVGPEPITGSTRMKGGSATKLMLETIFSLGMLHAGLINKKDISINTIHKCKSIAGQIKAFLERYEEARRAVYDREESLAELVKMAGDALRQNGHIYYVGYPPQGILGTVDASECPPTFGADFQDVRGFIYSGWKGLLGFERDHSHEGPLFRISTEEFEKVKLPKLKKIDLVIGIGIGKLEGKISALLKKCKGRGGRTAAVIVNCKQQNILSNLDKCISPELKATGFSAGAPIFAEYATKLVLNAITTGAHVLKGKVYQNRMVDLRISNNKLYFRTIGIVSSIMGVSEAKARESILKSVYNTDTLTKRIADAPISKHIEAGTKQEKLVPKAMLLATGKFNCAAAERALKKEPIVRNIIMSMLKGANK